MTAINLDTPLELKKKLFLQAYEEREHATIFKTILTKSSQTPFLYESSSRSIYYKGNDPYRFSRLCQIGEGDALTKFINIYKFTKNLDLKKGLHQIIKDEVEHSKDHENSLFRDKLYWFRYKYATLGNKVASQISFVLLTFVYFLLLPYTSILYFLNKAKK